MRHLSFLDKLIFALNLMFALLLLFSCAVPYISVESFPPISFLSLAVPLLVIANLLFLVYWLFKRKKQLLLSFFILFLGYLFLGSFYSFKMSEAPILENEISIMSYNVRGFNNNNWIDDPTIGDKIIGFVKENDPDILCFQEFSRIRHRQLSHYSYAYQTPYSNNRSVQVIYSKYPIIQNGSLDFPNSGNNAIFSDIVVGNDTLRVYNVHLQSLRVRPGSFKREEPQKLFKRLGNTFVKQQQQAEIFEQHRGATSYKKIVCADLNNTQFSNVYRTVKGDMQDSFREKGTGYGRTYNFKYFPVRIDFILADQEFEVRSHKNFDVRLSDHFPIMASFVSKSNR